mmetsp:Transcript_17633/g.32473  ORF Transcript_17633/g.32473 Transcript_17633/m.32473 type:complete len:87 (-) Transcript_17633:143-403(-)
MRKVERKKGGDAAVVPAPVAGSPPRDTVHLVAETEVKDRPQDRIEEGIEAAAGDAAVAAAAAAGVGAAAVAVAVAARVRPGKVSCA